MSVVNRSGGESFIKDVQNLSISRVYSCVFDDLVSLGSAEVDAMFDVLLPCGYRLHCFSVLIFNYLFIDLFSLFIVRRLRILMTIIAKEDEELCHRQVTNFDLCRGRDLLCKVDLTF